MFKEAHKSFYTAQLREINNPAQRTRLIPRKVVTLKININRLPIHKLYHPSFSNSRPYPEFLVPSKDKLAPWLILTKATF